MKSTKIKLVIDGQKVILGHESIIQIVNSIEDIKENAKVFELLTISSNLLYVKESLSHKNSLTRKSVKNLLKEKRHGIFTNLIRNQNSARLITEKEIIKILALDNVVHAESIADHLDYFEKCNIFKLAKRLSKHKDPSVRMALAGSWRTPKKILKKLTTDDDINVSKTAKESLA